ncbi:cytochrome P450, partial [Gautieria morchelliformis]
WKDKTKDSANITYNFIDPILKESLAKEAVADGAASQAKTLADHLVDHITTKNHCSPLYSIMIAGRDTTMSTLTFVIYCLSQNKDVLMKLRREILTMVGPTRTPVCDDVKDCKYLCAVINGKFSNNSRGIFEVSWCSQRRFICTPLCMYRFHFAS